MPREFDNVPNESALLRAETHASLVEGMRVFVGDQPSVPTTAGSEFTFNDAVAERGLPPDTVVGHQVPVIYNVGETDYKAFVSVTAFNEDVHASDEPPGEKSIGRVGVLIDRQDGGPETREVFAQIFVKETPRIVYAVTSSGTSEPYETLSMEQALGRYGIQAALPQNAYFGKFGELTESQGLQLLRTIQELRDIPNV